MRPTVLVAGILLVSACGEEVQTGRGSSVPEGQRPTPSDQRPAASDPRPETSGQRPATGSPPPAASAQPPASSSPPPVVLLDLAAADILERVKAAGQPEAGLRLAGEGAARALEFTGAAGAPYPGIAIAPAAGAWDLSRSAGVEARLQNAGPARVQIGLRVDEQGGGRDGWNGEVLRLDPGASGSVRVNFGTSWGKPGYKLDAAKVGRIQIYVEKPGEGCRLRLLALAPAGKAGEKPGATPPRAVPVVHHAADPHVLGFTAGIDAAHLRASGASIAAADGAAAITLAAATGEAVWKPAQPLDLRDYREAVFALRNPGTAALTVACRVEAGGDRAIAGATLAPGERREISVPFAAAGVWQGARPGAKPAAPADKPFTGAPEEHAGSGLASDAVGALAVAVDGAAGGVLLWEGVTAATGGPAVLPEWLGKRPPVDGDWDRIFADEFDGTALDTSHWTPRLPWIGPIPYELQCYDDRNVSVSGGCMRIRCEKRTTHLYGNPAWPERDYATGAVTTYPNWRWRYGYAEARMKLPRAIGLWPAFWTMPDRGPKPDEAPLPGDWEKRWDAARSNPDKNRRRSTDVDGMEFDIFEHPDRFGPFRYNIACHWDGYGAQHKSTGTSKVYSQPDADGFVVAGLLWEEGRVTWYCNGAPVGTWVDPRVASSPMSLKFTVQMGGWAGNEVDDSLLPEDFAIDWVRVWQRKGR